MSAIHVSFVMACAALITAILAPLVTLRASQRQFNASVLSTNREKWMASLREALAELASLVATLTQHKQRLHGDWPGDHAAQASDPGLAAKYERLVWLFWNIRLLTNPDEPAHRTLCSHIDNVVFRLRDGDASVAVTQRDIDAIVRAAHPVLRLAWRRVKQGN
ncbi:hypothetical protein B0G62_11862 [Paraburkholderia eburnea]|uniref:Uncharacterized protein n=1 Tax=Paraburkholderia eburnea TaxID=1189126 RepID=A0A2S4LYE1_9BURK|nr:hypothetical protein [Paraburkholderia eburnea]POR47471.1 hypothetical protein B0G62_11862 [Paraburkholderia eburnea]PRZ19059.1 hypothetical protein BX588_11862 [Paraburkholderia eburnea]